MNTFGNSTSQQYPLYDPRSVRENRTRFRRDVVPMLDRANSIYIPTGRWATRGWLLISRYDYSRISSYSKSLVLTVGDPVNVLGNVGRLGGLSIVQAQCVTKGITSDRNAIYLVEVTDGRGIAQNKWFSCPTAAASPVGYNIRSPAYPQDFYESTLNGSSPWTWSGMLQNMWEGVNTGTSSALGDWPGLPATPVGTPEGFWSGDVASWYPLNDILDHLGMTVACDLRQTNPFTIVRPGDADASYNTARTRYVSNIEDDQEWIDTGAGRIPGTVVVLFRRRNSVYGTEETVRKDSSQWSTTPYYRVIVSAPISGGLGTHCLWSDFTVRYDEDGAPLAVDTLTAATIASERATDYFRRIYRGTLGYMSETYAGALPFVTGSQVDGVAYYQDYRDQRRAGWKTKIVRGPCPAFAEVGRGFVLQEE